jgi:hypothetical protein
MWNQLDMSLDDFSNGFVIRGIGVLVMIFALMATTVVGLHLHTRELKKTFYAGFATTAN